MPEALELLRQKRTEELWLKCCGFIDLSMEAFMGIQRRLLLEQLELLKKCELGRKVMQGAEPRSVEEFREQVPLTIYTDYDPYLSEQREDVLPESPFFWQRTAGRSSEYKFKWAPVSRRLYQEIGESLLAVLIFATCKGRGDISFEEHDKFLYTLAPPPYASGAWAARVEEEQIFRSLPPIDEAEKMAFEDRVEQGFKLAMSQGLDLFFGISSILMAVGERFSGGMGSKRSMLPMLLSPRTLLRVGKGFLKSKLARRPMLPKDLWPLKGIVAFGTDTTIYREKVKEMWGKYPLEVYGCTESMIIALQTWDCQGMTFTPHFNFLEFIPAEEYLKWATDPAYQPSTLLLDEVRPGEKYVLAITNFLGGPFVRYIIGDMVKITALRNEELGIDLPQMAFESRVDGLIDLAGFTRLTERTIWQAIENSGLKYKEWTARKEPDGKPVLHLYLELKEDGNGNGGAKQAAVAIHDQLRKLDDDYANLEIFLGLEPLEVTLLPNGAFQEYISERRAAGADLAHLKPPHLNASDGMIASLLNGSRPNG